MWKSSPWCDIYTESRFGWCLLGMVKSKPATPWTPWRYTQGGASSDPLCLRILCSSCQYTLKPNTQNPKKEAWGLCIDNRRKLEKMGPLGLGTDRTRSWLVCLENPPCFSFFQVEGTFFPTLPCILSICFIAWKYPGFLELPVFFVFAASSSKSAGQNSACAASRWWTSESVVFATGYDHLLRALSRVWNTSQSGLNHWPLLSLWVPWL